MVHNGAQVRRTSTSFRSRFRLILLLEREKRIGAIQDFRRGDGGMRNPDAREYLYRGLIRLCWTDMYYTEPNVSSDVQINSYLFCALQTWGYRSGSRQ